MQNYRRLFFLVCIIIVSIATSLGANGISPFAGMSKSLDIFILELGHRRPQVRQDVVADIKEMNVSDDKILHAWARLSLLISRSGLLEDNTGRWLRTTDAVFGLIDLDETSPGLLDTFKRGNTGDSALALDTSILQLGDENPQVRQDAVTAIKDMNVNDDKLLIAWAKVMRLLMEGSIDRSRLEIRDAVFRLIDLDEALGGLLHLLKSGNKDESILARFVIKQIGETLKDSIIKPLSGTVPLLTESLKDPDAEVRETASCLLGAIPSHAQTVVPVLINALNDENQDVRAATVSALGDIARAVPEVKLEIADKLIEVLNAPNFAISSHRRDSNFHVRVAECLQSIGAAAVPTLVEAMNATDAGVRHHAAIALAGIGSEHDEETIPILTEALASPYRATRHSASYTFVDLAKRPSLVNTVLHALPNVLESTEDTVENRIARPNVVYTLHQIGIAIPEKKLEITEKLIAALNTPNFVTGHFGHFLMPNNLSNYHVDIANVLTSMGSAPEPLLVKALNATETGVRHHAAIALAIRGYENDKAIIPILTESLASPHRHTQAAAVRALFSLADSPTLVDQITPILANVLKTTEVDTEAIYEDMTLDEFIVETLLLINPHAINDLFRSEAPYVQRRVLSAIVNLAQILKPAVEDAVPVVKELSSHDDSILQSAIEALIALDQSLSDDLIATFTGESIRE